MEMSIVDRLNQKHATPETVLEVMKASVFEVSGDKTAEEMLDELRAAAGDASAIEAALGELRTNSGLIRQVALTWLSVGAEAEDAKYAIHGAVEDADRQMPLLETSALALIALYAIYAISRIPKRQEVRIKHSADGSWSEERITEFETFDAPVRGLISIFMHKS